MNADFLPDLRQAPLRLILGDAVGRHEIKDVAERPQKQPALQKSRSEERPDIVKITVAGEFHHPDAADHTHVPYVIETPQRFQPIPQMRLKARDAMERALFPK